MTRTPPSLFVLCTVVAMSSAACGGGGGVSTRTDGGADTGTEGGPDTATDGSVDALDSGLSGELVGPPPCVPGEEECRPSRLAVAPGITCAIDSAGELLCWGTNAGGLAGSGTSDSKVPPTVVAVAGPWTTVSAGPRAVCAIHENLRLYCWGTGTIGAGTVPTEIAPGTSWRDITVGDMHLCGIHDDGTLWCRGVVEGWLPEPERAHTTFTQVGTATDWESIEASDRTCGIRSGGALLCWGRAFAGVGQVATPTEIAPGTDWRTVSLGPDSACAIDSSGALFCWGNEVTGDLGDGQNAPAGHATPQPIATGQTWVSVAVSGGFSCAVDTAGATWCWGREGLWPGRAGDVRHAPRRIATGRTATEVALSRFTGAAGVHACVALSDGTHSCFGSNAFGQLGMGTASATVELRPVAAGTWDRAPSIGGHSVCGIDADAA